MNAKTPNHIHGATQTSAAEDSHEEFLLRWRGRIEGPCAIGEIQRRLSANEIGMFHEVQRGGVWLPLRTLLAEREAEHVEEDARREAAQIATREEKARAAAELEARQLAEMLVEERRRNDLMEKATQSEPPKQSVPDSGSGANGWGGLLLVIGIIVAGYFLFFFDPSVYTGFGRVNNIGLLQDRQNGLLVGVAMAIVGAVLLAFGNRSRT